MADIEGFAARLEVQKYDQNAAVHTGQLRAELAKAGTPIGPYDQMIAGHARSQGLILVTNNLREFDRVLGLRIEDWLLVRQYNRVLSSLRFFYENQKARQIKAYTLFVPSYCRINSTQRITEKKHECSGF